MQPAETVSLRRCLMTEAGGLSQCGLGARVVCSRSAGRVAPAVQSAVNCVLRAKFCALAIALVLGCAQDERNTLPRSQKMDLTDEKARAALIEMVNSSSSELLNASLPSLRTAEVAHIDQDVIDIGDWRCNLKSRRFVFSFATDKLLAEYAGEFRMSARQEWVAVVTSKRHAHSPPP